MGMFDNIHLEEGVELPDGATKNNFEKPGRWVFQTKSFDCLMDDYKITKDGKLMRLNFEEVEDGTTFKFPGSDEEWPRYERVNEEWLEYSRDGRKFHGEFNFYSHDDEGKWHEYIAVFNHGQLEGIVADEEKNKIFRKIQNVNKAKVKKYEAMDR